MTAWLAWLIDLPRRALLLAGARLALRRPSSPRLIHLRGPRLLAAMLRATGRHLAVALALLPRSMRQEASLAYLACRTLDAYEDLAAPDPALLRRVGAALCGRIPCDFGWPALLRPRSDRDLGELALAARLPALAAAIAGLPATSRVRLHALVTSVAEAMARWVCDRAQGTAPSGDYADDVLGEPVTYVCELLAPGAPPPWRARQAAARVLQTANDLRDAELDALRTGHPPAQARTWLEVIFELPLAPLFLEEMGARTSAAGRAAMVYMAVTTGSFFSRQAGLRPSLLLRWPLGAALAAGLARPFYERVLWALEAEARRVLPCLARPAGAQTARSVRGHRLARYERRVAAAHASPQAAAVLQVAATLASVAADLTDELPRQRLDGPVDGAVAGSLLASDYVVLGALRWLQDIGPTPRDGHAVIAGFGACLTRSALTAAQHGSRGTELTAYLARLTAEANGLRGAPADTWIAAHVGVAAALDALDGARGPVVWSQRRRAVRAAASAAREVARTLVPAAGDCLRADASFAATLATRSA